MDDMELYDVMRTTAAVREFTDDPLPDEVLERILDNARFAPSGGNRQGTHVVVVRDPQTRDRLAELAVPGARRYIAQLRNGEGPWNPLQPCGVDAETIAAVEVPRRVTAARRASGAGGLRRPGRRCGIRPRPRPDRPHRRRVGVPVRLEHSAGRAQRGLRRRPHHDGGGRGTAVKELLGIPDDYAIAALLPLGKPVRQVTKLKRKPVAEFASRERFDGEPFSA